VVSAVSWFHRVRGLIGFCGSAVSWFHRFHGFAGFVVS